MNLRKIIVIIFLVTLFFYKFAFANPILDPPFDYIADPEDVVIKFTFFSIIFYLITGFVESIVYIMFFCNMEISKFKLLGISFKINFLTFPITQFIVLAYYYIVSSNQNYYLTSYYFNRVSRDFRTQNFSEFIISICAITFLILLSLLIFYKLRNKFNSSFFEKSLIIIFITSSALILSDIILFLIFNKIIGDNNFNYLSNCMQLKISNFGIMKNIITKYHFNFFQHYINIFIEISVTICEFFLIKHYVLKFINKTYNQSIILLCAIFANVVSLLIGDFFIYYFRIYLTYHNMLKFERFLYFF